MFLSSVKKLSRGLLNFALPPLCVCCENILEHCENFVCKKCFSELELIDDSDNLLQVSNEHLIDDLVSVYAFPEEGGFQNIMHALKYREMRSIGVMFGKILGEKILTHRKFHYDLIVPVPLHISKQRERIYNQSCFVAKGISEVTGIPAEEKILMRSRYTKSQTKLDHIERELNIKNAFYINENKKKLIPGKNIILVDDVITTGSTIVECAKVLKECGAKKIMTASIARA